MIFKPELCKEYTLIKTEDIKELNSIGYLLMHNKTKARVALMANEDQNKVFSIGFRTPVENDTGVAHIVEHTVLCGSKKYPLKDPFVELVKGSMNTFLNAMTFPDKTIYPVASLNDKDFHNLMDVYLDAVFNPRIYDKEEIFAKEGWHYTVSEDGELGVNGIVYNEMKGVFSKPEDVIMSKSMAYLFPDTCYKYESGGDPDHIYELSYDEYKDFHSRYYHPSNSFIFLYGDMDFNEKLEYIDKEYLCKYEYLDIDSTIHTSKDFDEPKYVTDYYSVSDGEEVKDKDYLAYICTAGDGVNTELYYAMKVLDYTLVSMPGAPVRKAIIDAGIGEDVFGGEQNLKDRFFMIAAKYANASDMEKFKDVIEKTLKDIVNNGIDKDSLRAALNVLEFNYREGDFGSYPKGIFYLIDGFESWLYDDTKPFLHLKAGDTFEYLNKMVETDYFEKLIEKYLLNNNHKVYLTLAAKPGLLAKKDEELKKKLADLKASWSNEELEKAVSLEKAIEEYVNSEDSEEDLKKIPVLELSDLKKEAERFVIEEISDKVNGFDGKKVLYSNIPTNGIAYLMIGFDIEKVPTEMLPYVGLLKYIICNIDTEKYEYMDLNNIVNMNSGGLSNDISGIVKDNNNSNYMFTFDTNIKIFYNKMQFAFEIIEEMLLHSKLDDVKRLKEIFAEAKSGLEEGILGQGHNRAISRAMSNYSESSFFAEKMSGLDFYMFVKNIYDNFDEKKDEIVAKLKEVINFIFTRENMIAHLTAEETALDSFVTNLSEFMNKLSNEKYEKATREFVAEHRAEGFKTPSSVQFVARSGSYKAEGYSYSGAFKVLSNILAYGYLWENIREKGGAYGCMYRPTKSGKISFVSYRDPKLKETNEVYNNLPAYLRDFEATDRQMSKYIIGAISTVDTPKTPRAKGASSLAAYLAEISYDEIQKERDEILATTSEDIRGLAETFETALSNSSICVIGNADKIEECNEMFTDVIEIIK